MLLMLRLRRWAVGGLCAISLALARLAAASANDDFSNRLLLPTTNRVAVTTDNSGATSEPGEPSVFPGAAGATVWFQWTPPANGNYLITTDGSVPDTALGVFTGSEFGSLVRVATDNDSVAPGGIADLVALTNAVAGTAYQIAVDAMSAQRGRVTLSILPNNDRYEDRLVINSTAALTPAYNGQAGREPYEHNHAAGAINRSTNAPGKTLWWEWNPPAPGAYFISTYPATFQTVVSAYRSTGPNLTNLVKLASDTATDWGGDRAYGTFGNLLAVTITDTNASYRIAVDGYPVISDNTTSVQNGRLTLSVQPGNDQLTNAAPLAGLGRFMTGFNGLATVEPGETNRTTAAQQDPFNPQFIARRSLWWKWSPPANGSYLITTFGSPFNTFIGVFTNAGSPATIAGLAWAAAPDCSDDDGAALTEGTSLVSLPNASSNQTYYIMVDGAYDANRDNFGAIQLVIVPNNDRVANCIPLSGNQAVGVSYNGKAGGETGEPLPPGSEAHTNSVWWSWVAPANGVVTLDTAPSSFVTLLAVWTGSAPDFSDYQLAAWDAYGTNDFRSLLTCPVQGGQEYKIQVAGMSPAEYGEVALNLGFEALASPPHIASASLDASGRFQLTFPALSGYPYQVHDATQVNGPWNPGEIIIATNRVMSWTAPLPAAGAPTRFFRISEVR